MWIEWASFASGPLEIVGRIIQLTQFYIVLICEIINKLLLYGSKREKPSKLVIPVEQNASRGYAPPSALIIATIATRPVFFWYSSNGFSFI